MPLPAKNAEVPAAVSTHDACGVPPGPNAGVRSISSPAERVDSKLRLLLTRPDVAVIARNGNRGGWPAQARGA